MDGGGERESTKHEVDTEYHCHDFDWEDLRADVEANTSFSYHLSPFPANTASPPPPSSEAWRSFHRRHASGKFFKEHELDHIGRGFEFVGLVQYCILDLGNDCTSWRSPPEGDRLKINCDGAYSEETGNGGWGFTIRDREGNFRGSGAGCIAHATSAAMAEALACQEAVYAAASWGMGSLQLETDAQNLVKAMQERRYLLKEFPDLLNSKECAKVLEVGCGNGSTVVSILRCCPSITVYACDCSEDILQKANEIVCNTQGVDAKDRFHPFLLDVSRESFPDWLFCYLCQSSGAKAADPLLDSGHHNIRKEQPIWLKENQCCIHGIDFITMIFTLSAIPYDIMSATLQRCVSVLKPGGLVLFRDYGIYDMTMLRFLPHQRVGFREYIHADGTFSYYFSLDTVRELFDAAGLLELELEYCCVRSVNRKNGKSMQRVWVHGKFQKPTI